MNPLTLFRPLASIDVESTGLSITQDRIVSLAIVIRAPNLADVFEKNFLFNPGFEMKQEVIDLHGITNEMVKDAPKFEEKADEILSLLDDCDLVGYNLNRFDIPILHEHFARCGKDWDVRAVNVIDVGSLFQIREPRTLEAAVKKYCGREHIGAHDALNDAKETLAVLDGMRAHYADLSDDVHELAKATVREEAFDLAGKIIKGKDGRPAYSFGERTRGVAVEDDPGFGRWMLGKDFPADTCRVIREILKLD